MMNFVDGSTHCFTSFTFSYLSRARLLANTVRSAHPDWIIWAMIVDEIPDSVSDNSWRDDFHHIVLAKELDLPHFGEWLFKHDIVEVCTSVKGHMLLRVLDSGAARVVYLDPDIAVFHPLDNIINDLQDCSIVLTPHQVDHNLNWRDIQDNEMTSLQYGIYNLGFVAVRNDDAGRKFAHWWAGRLYDACYDDVENGIFTDQKYCDLVPALFDGVKVERDPGLNVASWNLSRREISIDRDGCIWAGGPPLKFYHFTKMGSAGDVMTERYARGRIEVFEIWEWYRRSIKYYEVSGLPNRYWAYSNFENGEPIAKAARLLFRRLARPLTLFGNPYRVGEGSFYKAWKEVEASTPHVEGFDVAAG